jgi:hypothetical protein
VRAGIVSIATVAVIFAGCSIISFNLERSPEKGVERSVVVDETGTSGDSVTVIADPEYQAGSLHRTFWGDHYRDLWATSLKVKVLDLSTFAGGLTPLKEGGGLQTQSLRFQGSDGRQYTFRSVNKNPRKALPPDLQDSFAADIVRDQISSHHPASALIVDALATGLGVLHPKPMLCILPDDERLGKFRDDFAGILGMLEEFPADGPEGQPGFAGSTKIKKTLRLFDELDKNSSDKVNSRAFLTARLLDILVGDWDRHIDQWRWARFKEGGNDVWFPIARDRDQAFARLEGFFPWIGTMALTRLEGFDDYDNIYGLTHTGRFLDRRLLVDLDESTWASVTSAVLAKLTDEVIERAVGTLPGPYYKKNAAYLTRGLKFRRDGLREASRIFYQQLSDFVDIRLSKKREFVEVKRLDDERVEVTAYLRDKKTGEPKGDEVYHRVFYAKDTKDIRIYLLGGDDKAVVIGDVESSITVRVIGGKGDDELIDQSEVHGDLFSFIPFIPKADKETHFYDHSGKNTFVTGPSTSVDESKYETPPPKVARLQY